MDTVDIDVVSTLPSEIMLPNSAFPPVPVAIARATTILNMVGKTEVMDPTLGIMIATLLVRVNMATSESVLPTLIPPTTTDSPRLTRSQTRRKIRTATRIEDNTEMLVGEIAASTEEVIDTREILVGDSATSAEEMVDKIGMVVGEKVTNSKRVVGITVVAVGERAVNTVGIRDSKEVVVGVIADVAEEVVGNIELMVGATADSTEVISVPKVVIKKLKVISSPLICY
jgi:hypothetical protein